MGDEQEPGVARYMAVFAALLLLTLLTVAVAGLHLPRREAIPVGLLIACVKAGLIAAVFMHLWGERRIVDRVLLVAAFFACALMTFNILDARIRRRSGREIQNAKVDRDAQAPPAAAGPPDRVRGLPEGSH